MKDAIEATNQSTLDAIGARVVHVSRAHHGGDSVIDLDATYHAWFASIGARAVIVRPDFYVFSTANTAEELNASIQRLATLVTGAPALQAT